MADRKLLENDRIKTLSRIIQKSGGVLFLGPGVLNYRDTDIPLLKKFTETIPDKFGLGRMDNDDNRESLSYVLQKAMVIWRDYLNSAKEGYKDFFEENSEPSDIFKNLAKLNFKLIINTNPDKELYNHLQGTAGKDKYFDYYDCSNGVSTNQEVREKLRSFSFDDNIKLQYNLLGTFDQPSSIRLCEQDYLEMIENIYTQGKEIPACIKTYINSNVPLVFLGFDFDQWHYKILFKIFRIGLEKTLASSLSIEERRDFEMIKKPLSIHTKTSYPIPGPRISSFFEGEFNIAFEQFDIGDYVYSLAKYINPANEEKTEYPPQPLVTTLLYCENSPMDEALKEKFVTHFRLLGEKYYDQIWNISMIPGGSNWEADLEKRLLKTEVLILLLSAEFHSNQDFKNPNNNRMINYGEYVEKFIQAAPADKIQIFPVILRTYDYEAIRWLKNKSVRDNVQPKLNEQVVAVNDDKDRIDQTLNSVVEFIRKKILLSFTRN